jgi:hypothetical protein
MRRPILTLATLAAILAIAPVSLAAPTCRDAHGETRRCGTSGAMPVGWIPREGAGVDRAVDEPSGPTPTQIIGLAGAIGGLLTLVALMPDFEDRRGGGWDRQEGDEEARR